MGRHLSSEKGKQFTLGVSQQQRKDVYTEIEFANPSPNPAGHHHPSKVTNWIIGLAIYRRRRRRRRCLSRSTCKIFF